MNIFTTEVKNIPAKKHINIEIKRGGVNVKNYYTKMWKSYLE